MLRGYSLSIWVSVVNGILKSAQIPVEFMTQLGPVASRPSFIAYEANSSIQGFDAGPSKPVLTSTIDFQCEDESTGGQTEALMSRVISALYMPQNSNRVAQFQAKVTELHPELKFQVLSVELSTDQATEESAPGQAENESILGFKMMIMFLNS